MKTLRFGAARGARIRWTGFALLTGLALTGVQAAPPVIPDLDVAGPGADFDMSSRLMTSGKRMEVWLSVPGNGKVRVPRFNGTFFYRESNPQATTATLVFRCDQLENVEGRMAKQLIKVLEPKHHPFFAFQSRSALATKDGIDLKGRLIVKDRETDATLHMKSPGKVALNDKGERWIAMDADMEVAASEIGLDALGERLRFDFKMFLFNYTVQSAKNTGINPAALDRTPPQLPRDAAALSDSGWYLMLTQRYEEAIEAFDKSIELNPTSVGAYMRRGDAYAFSGQYGKAVGTYRLMWDIMPMHPHLIELRKVLAGEYLTPARMRESNTQWHATQRR